MPKAFDFSSPPFDRLRPAEVARVAAAVDVVFLRQGQPVLRAGDLPDFLYIVIKGAIEERHRDQIVQLHGPGDGFDSEILIHQACRHDFVVREEAICYRLPIEDFVELTANNTSFAAFFLADIRHKLDSLAQRRASPETLGALTVRVGQALLHPPIRIPATATLHEAGCAMHQHDQRAILVDAGGRVGIVTGVDLTRAAVCQRLPLETPVGGVSHFDLLTVDEAESLAEAALVMARRKVRHLVVRRDGAIAGILDAASALSSLAGQSDAIGLQIAHATGLQDLVDAAERVTQLVRQLHGNGTKIGFITSLASDLNARIAARLWEQLAPPALREASCLVIMGSEGRREQVLRTDQDNGLILTDDPVPREMDDLARRFGEAMVACGFPPCPGEVMVGNQKWRQTLAEWRASLRDWITRPGEQALIDIAIFYDASAIAGDGRLLEQVRDHLFELLAGNQAFHAHFARAIDSFETPLGLLGNIIVERGAHKDAIDLKKGGIFPIVHGVRALALERRLCQTGTIERIRALAEDGVFERDFAAQLSDAFSALLGLRLQARLERMRLHLPADNFLRPADLTKLERDLLRDALQLAKRLKELVRHHFRLGLF